MVRAGLGHGKKPVVEPHVRRLCVPRADPMDVALDLVLVRGRRAGAGIRVVGGVYYAVLHAGALHHVAKAQADVIPRI